MGPTPTSPSNGLDDAGAHIRNVWMGWMGGVEEDALRREWMRAGRIDRGCGGAGQERDGEGVAAFGRGEGMR
jgi:hypothetical protein